MRDALDALTADQREAVVLKFYFGMTSPQIAQSVGSTPGAIRALVHRGLATLRRVLSDGIHVSIDEEAADVS